MEAKFNCLSVSPVWKEMSKFYRVHLYSNEPRFEARPNFSFIRVLLAVLLNSENNVVVNSLKNNWIIIIQLVYED